MCHHCVMDSVKQQMLDRRSFFKGAAVAAASAAALTVGATAQASAATTGYHDMTHELHPNFPTYFGTQQLFMDQKFNYAEHKFNLFELRINEHTGTHMDAPLHFSADGMSVAEIPVDKLVVPLAVIDIREKAAANADAQVTPDDIKAWTAANGPLPKCCCVANLSALPAKGATLIVGAPKIRGGTGGPSRVFAMA